MPNPSFMATPRAPMRGQAKAPIAGQGAAPAVSPAANIAALAQARTTSPQRPVENQFAPAAPAPRALGGGQYQAPEPATPAPDPYKAALDTVSQTRAGQNAVGLNGNTGSAAGFRMANPPQPEQRTIPLPAGAGATLAGQAVANAGITPETAASAYYGDTEEKNKEAQARALYDALTGSNMDYSAMTPEMLAAQSQKLNAAGIQQQYDMQRALAAQGIGSGMGAADIAGLGVQTARNVSDAQTAAALQGQEARMQAIRDLMQGVSSTRSGDQAQQQIDMAQSAGEWGRTKETEADAVAMVNTVAGWAGADQLGPKEIADGLAAYKQGPEAFDAWIRSVGASTNASKDGTRTLTTAPEGYSGDWSSLTAAQQAAVAKAIQAGYNPDRPPRGFDLVRPGDNWEAMSDAERAHEWGLFLNRDPLYDRVIVPR